MLAPHSSQRTSEDSRYAIDFDEPAYWGIGTLRLPGALVNESRRGQGRCGTELQLTSGVHER